LTCRISPHKPQSGVGRGGGISRVVGSDFGFRSATEGSGLTGCDAGAFLLLAIIASIQPEI
jgi:hypothetical protein